MYHGESFRRGPKGQRFLACLRWVSHEPIEADHASSALGNVVHGGDGQKIRPDDALDLLDVAGESVDVLQRGWIEDTVGVFFVDDAHDDNVMKVEVLLDLIVKHPRRLVGGIRGASCSASATSLLLSTHSITRLRVANASCVELRR